MLKKCEGGYVEWDDNGDLVVVFPPDLLKKWNLKEGSAVDVLVINGELVIKPIKKKKKKGAP